MSAYHTDTRIDDYISTLPGWQQDMCRQVRDLVHAADPEVTETINPSRQVCGGFPCHRQEVLYNF